MHLFFRRLSIVIPAFALLVAGCSKESSTTEPEGTAPSIPTVNFKGPTTSSQDYNAQLTVSMVSAMNAYTLLFTPFASLPATQSGNTSTWTYTDRTLTVTFTATRQGDGSFTWKMVLNGVDPDDQTAYSNWTGLEGTTSADGKNGNWKIYAENTTILDAEYIWATTNNVLTGTLKIYDNTVVSSQTVVVNNPDGTGELRMYDGTILTYKSVWQANGSGQWWTYDSTGAQTGTGTWT